MIPLRLAASLGGLAALLLGAKLFVSNIERRGYERCAAEHTAAALEAAQEGQRLTRIAVDKNREVTDGLRKEKQRIEAAAASDRAQLHSLRIAIDEASSRDDGAGDSAARFNADGERIALLGRLLGEAADLATEGGERVAELASKVDALQTYATRVCVR